MTRRNQVSIVSPYFQDIKMENDKFRSIAKYKRRHVQIKTSSIPLFMLSPCQYAEADDVSDSAIHNGDICLFDKAGINCQYSDGCTIHFEFKDKCYTASCGISKSTLARSLIYFDHIIWPVPSCSTKFGQFNPDIDFLVDNGVMSMPMIPTENLQTVGEKFFYPVHEFYNYVDNKDLSNILVQDGNDIILPYSDYAENANIMFTLYNALPVPQNDVSYVEIVEFRHKNNALLHDFRAEIDRIYLDICSSPEDWVRRNSKIHELERIISGIVKGINSAGIRHSLFTMSVCYSAPMIGAFAGTTSLLHGFQAPLELTLAASTVTGLAAMFKIDIRRGPIFKDKPITDTPFAYVWHLREQFTRSFT